MSVQKPEDRKKTTFAKSHAHAEEMFQALKEQPFNTTDGDGRTALSYAAELGSEAKIELIYKQARGNKTKEKEAVNSPDHAGQTPLFYAVKYASETDEAEKTMCALMWLKQHSSDIEKRDNKGRTALFYASGKQCNTIVTTLLRLGSTDLSIDPRDFHQDTPLAYAAAHGNLALFQVLVKRKANIEAYNKDGHNAVMLAAMHGNQRILDLLLTMPNTDKYIRDKIVEPQDQLGRTALLLAAKNNHQGAVRALITFKVDIDHRDRKGNTALKLAVANGLDEMTALLLDNGAGMNTSDSADQHSELWMAAETQQEELLDLLVGAWVKRHPTEIPPALTQAIAVENDEIFSQIMASYQRNNQLGHLKTSSAPGNAEILPKVTSWEAQHKKDGKEKAAAATSPAKSQTGVTAALNKFRMALNLMSKDAPAKTAQSSSSQPQLPTLPKKQEQARRPSLPS